MKTPYQQLHLQWTALVVVYEWHIQGSVKSSHLNWYLTGTASHCYDDIVLNTGH